MKENIKTWLIILLIIIIGLFGLFGGKRVLKYKEEISSLKTDKKARDLQISKRDLIIKFQNDSIKKQEAEIFRLQKIFKAKDIEVLSLTADLDSALKWLNFITADSSYQFLQTVAYNYPGALKYLFNELQLRYIHSDYITARNSEKVIPLMTAQINNAEEQFAIKANIEKALKNVIGLQKESLADCAKSNEDSNLIIKDTEKQRDKEARRKNFWRFTSAVEAVTLIVLAVFGL